MADITFKKDPVPAKSVAETLQESLKTVPEVAKVATDAMPAPTTASIPRASIASAKVVAKADKPKEVVSSATEDEIDISTLTEEEALALDSIVARPLGYGNALNITIKRNEYSYRWVNRQEQRQATMRALGFQPATLDDVETPYPDAFRDGVIQMGDVILMKMRKATYFAALKNNVKKAIIMGSKEGLDKASMSEAGKVLKDVKGDPSKVSKLVAPYVPRIGELG